MVKKYLERVVFGVFTSIVWISMSVVSAVFIIPYYVQLFDEVRFEQDVDTAEKLTWVLNLNQADEDMLQDPFLVIERLETAGFEMPVPKSHHTVFVYDAGTARIDAYRIESLLVEADLNSVSQPTEVFQAGRYFLSSSHCRLTALQQAFAQCASGMDCLNQDQLFKPSWRVRIDSFFEGHVLQRQISEPVALVFSDMIERFHPSRTLFVNNRSWHLEAADVTQIDTVVFAPGLSRLPAFTLPLTPCSIEIETLTLPQTVRTIESGAFPATFCIESLNHLGQQAIYVEADAMEGVSEVLFPVSELSKDAPGYEITDLYQGNPLVTYNPEHVALEPAVNMRNLIAYFRLKGIEVERYNIAINQSDFSRTKVYVYTEHGYYGYVIAKPLIE